jgi:rubrerythrin
MNYTELLVVAIKKENLSYQLYIKLAAISMTKELRDIFLKLAQEEAEHRLRFEYEYDLTTF